MPMLATTVLAVIVAVRLYINKSVILYLTNLAFDRNQIYLVIGLLLDSLSSQICQRQLIYLLSDRQYKARLARPPL